MASPLTASGAKGSFLLVLLLLVFATLFYYKMAVNDPSIIDHFESKTFESNYRVFRNAIAHAHLHYQTNRNKGCDIDCWIREQTGLDFNNFGYPISTRYSQQNSLYDPLTSNSADSHSDCAQIWIFLMGPLHNSINSETDNYQATFDQVSENCLFTTLKYPDKTISYDAYNGSVRLIYR